MSEKETGGPAFPVFPESGGGHAAAFQGMTLRDYFAAKAMQSALQVFGSEHPSSGNVAEAAYRMADAMLEASK